MADDGAIDIGEGLDIAPKKRKTTYNRLHPTENPKPPKRSRAEIQAAAAEKKATATAKKKEQVDLQAAMDVEKQQKRQKTLKEVAAMEDAIQRKQKQHQLQAERPDLRTIETYQTIQEDNNVEIQPPSQSIVDTDSDGLQLGGGNSNFGGEDGELEEDEDDMYLPSEDNNDNPKEDVEEYDDDASVEHGKTSMKRQAKTQKLPKGKLRADIQVHRKNRRTDIYPSKCASGNTVEIGGLQKDWKERVHPQTQTHRSSLHASVASDEFDDKNDQVAYKVQAIQKKQQTAPKVGGMPGQSNHQEGTKTSGIRLQKFDSKKAIGNQKSQRRRKPRYTNSSLPFKNFPQDLKIWRNSVTPAIIDWAGTLEDSFGANAHPRLPEIVQLNWNESFPLTECDEVVLSVASSAIRNWRSSIGKYALLRLTQFLQQTEPYKNSRDQRQEYVAEQLQDLRYIYCDPDTKAGAYRSPAVIEIFTVHLQVVAKSDKIYGYPAGALSLCAAAQERALKLWRFGDPPDKDSKTSFVRKPWAIRAAAHFQTIKKLSERKWLNIFDATTLAMGSFETGLDPTCDSELDDPDQVIVISESEDEAPTSD